MSVLCQACKTRPAKIHYKEIVNSNMMAIDLCFECAEEKGIGVNKSVSYGMGDLIAGLIDTTVDSDAEKVGGLRCNACGYEHADFKRIGRFGCPECYDAFALQLVPLLRHVHGSTQHAGKTPPASGAGDGKSTSQKLAALRAELARKIDAEQYERAAEIRDEIRDLETGEGDNEV